MPNLYDGWFHTRVKWVEVIVVHMGIVNYYVFRYLIEEISDESIPMVWDSAKL